MLVESEPAGIPDTMGFEQYHPLYGMGMGIPGHRCSVQQDGCSVAKANPQYTHIKPYLYSSMDNTSKILHLLEP